MLKQFITIISFSLFAKSAFAQTCTNIGQTPESAFPVCGTAPFIQNNVPICGQTNIPVPCTDGAMYQNKNPYWYKFTCYVAGTLGFTITPNNLGDDYDWQLFDITGHNPQDVFTVTSLFVCCNWSGESGVTGASAAGTGFINCAGFGIPLFSAMPTLIAGHEYLLLVSHFTNSQSGYQILFTGGTAGITDPVDPLLQNARISCDGTQLVVHTNKKIKCTSMAPNGSDFIISGGASVLSAISSACNLNFDTDTIVLVLSNPLPPGNYTLTIQNGNDGNTLLDDCSRAIPPGNNLTFNMKDIVSADFTYTMRTGCKNDTLSFLHDGRNGVTSWNWSFDNSSTSSLQNPVQIYSASSQHNVQLIVSDGICKDTVSQNIVLDNKVIADFETNNFLCPEDSAVFLNKSTGSIDSWSWIFGNGNTSTIKDPIPQLYPPTGRETAYTVKLVASSSSLDCKDSVSHTIRVLGSCYIAVPSAFTPNGDGLNDYLYPLNAVKADNLEFRVYNRGGQLIFESRNWLKKWDGRFNDQPQPAGVYVWYLRFTHHDTGKKFFMKGTTVLIR